MTALLKLVNPSDNSQVFNVQFIADRNGDVCSMLVELPAAVPANQIIMAVKARLRVNGFPEAKDVVIPQTGNIFTAIECGVSSGYETVAAGF